MAPTLRIIHDQPAGPAFNMAADLHLLQAAASSDAVTVRFYSWDRPTISLGHSQQAADALDLEAMARDRVAWIRRPTGGRAVLHHGDLTYSVVFGRHLRSMGKTVAESYRIIAGCLLAGLRLAGAPCEAHDSPLDVDLVKQERKLPCFLAPSRDEIMAGGRKLIGSAQKRTASAVLQHGSIPLTPDFRRLPSYSAAGTERRRIETELFERKCVCLLELAPKVDALDLRRALAAGFVHTLGLEHGESGWSAGEIADIGQRAIDPEFLREYAR